MFCIFCITSSHTSGILGPSLSTVISIKPRKLVHVGFLWIHSLTLHILVVANRFFFLVIFEFITLFLRREPRMPWMWRKGSQLQTLSCRVFVTGWVGGRPKALSFQGDFVQWPEKSWKPLCWKDSGCTALVSAGARARHATTYLFRPVRCPIFSSSCLPVQGALMHYPGTIFGLT